MTAVSEGRGTTAYIGLGGNLGERRELLRRATLLLGEVPGVRVRRASALYESEPWGVREQPPYLNAALEVVTTLPPEELLAACKRIEAACGRVPTYRWGPRPADLDILVYGDVVREDPDLTLPHPRLRERVFALRPLADLAPGLVLPGGGNPADLCRALPDQGVRRVAGTEWAAGLVEDEGAITDVPGVEVGQVSDREGWTGCTVVLTPEGAVCGADVRGAAPGTRETDLLDPGRLVERVHAVLLAGGSAFGLDAAAGVVAWLEERGAGFDTGVARVPIVPAAILFDLTVGSPRARPDARMGREACARAGRGRPEEGNAGAGTGATVGKLLGPAQAMKGGVGTASLHLPGGAVVGALVAVNAFGEVLDPWNGVRLAGPRVGPGCELVPPEAWLEAGGSGFAARRPGEHTTLAVVATDAALDRSGAHRLAQVAHDGLARTVFPAHTAFDGDTVFALSTGRREADPVALAAAAVEVVARATVRAVLRAESLPGLPSARSRLAAMLG